LEFDTINLLSGKVFQITWDLGRRCNYDCTYCPVTRHDNFSPHASLDELKSSVNFVYSYIDLYMQYRKEDRASISFTGGEPTVNPNFIPFVKYLKEAYDEKYKGRWQNALTLTTNGAMSQKMAQAVIDNLSHVTVSYHAESKQKLKDQVSSLKKLKITVTLGLMLMLCFMHNILTSVKTCVNSYKNTM